MKNSNCLILLLLSVVCMYLTVSCDDRDIIHDTDNFYNFSENGGTRSIALSKNAEWTGFLSLKINGVETPFDSQGVSVDYCTINGQKYVTKIKTEWFSIEKASNEKILYSVEKSNDSRYFSVEILYDNQRTELVVSQNIEKDGKGNVPEFPSEICFGLEGGTQTIVSKNNVPDWYFYNLWINDTNVNLCALDDMKTLYPEMTWLNTISPVLADSNKPFSIYKVSCNWFVIEKLNDYTIKIDVSSTDTPRQVSFDAYLGNTSKKINIIQR